jgi:hypothetical protein
MPRKKRSSFRFSLNLPLIISIIVGYNIFFGDDEKTVEVVDQNKIQIEQTADSSKVIDQTKESLINLKNQTIKEFQKVKEEVVKEIEIKKEEVKKDDIEEKEQEIISTPNETKPLDNTSSTKLKLKKV